jgi:DNA-binding NarL/FixJ family response regulator
MPKTRVFIADDHAVLRAGLRMLLNSQPDMTVVGEASTARQALDLAKETQPDVMTLDLSMPGGSSIKIIERMRQDCPSTRIVVLTMHDDPAYLRTVLAAGGSGYVVKTAADSELLTAIRAVARGRTFVDLDLADAHTPTAGKEASLNQLSQREREVLHQLAHGHTNQEIADGLHLSVKTVETYRARIAVKLGLRRRADIIRYAMETGILAPGSQ